MPSNHMRWAFSRRTPMRLALILGLSLFANGVWADLWVTPTGAGAADGTSLANACAGGTGGTSDADCTTFTDGETVHYCGAFTTILTVPNAGTDADSINVYTGNCPGGTDATITTTSGAAINQNKAFTTVEYFTLRPGGITTSDRGIILAANDITAQYNTIEGSGRSIEFGAAASRARITVQGNTIRDSVLNPIVWSYACGSAFDFEDITITGNFLYDNGTAVSKPNGITLQYTANTAGCEMRRISITDNYIEGQGGNAIIVDHATDAVTNEDITVTGNECGPGNDGCIAVHSFGSSTSAYGKNVIANNEIRGTLGDTGGVNLFYSQYVDVYGNTCDGLSSSNIDGNCILVDHDNDNVRVYQNFGKDLTGSSADNSGVGVMLLDSTNVSIYSNAFANVKNCFWFSGETNESGNLVANNSCSNASLYGVRVQAAADADSLEFKNNVISGAPVGVSAEAGAGNQNFGYNLISATTAYDVGGAFTPANDQDPANPRFLGGDTPTTAEAFRLSASSPLIAAGTDLGDEITDFFGDPLYNGSWDIGAFRRDSCYRRSRDGKLDMARTRAQVASRCLGIPGRYPEGL